MMGSRMESTAMRSNGSSLRAGSRNGFLLSHRYVITQAANDSNSPRIPVRFICGGGAFQVRVSAGASRPGPDSARRFPPRPVPEKAIPLRQPPHASEGDDWRKVGVPTEFGSSVKHARLAAHEKALHPVLRHRRKDSEYRVRDRVSLLIVKKYPTAHSFPASVPAA